MMNNYITKPILSLIDNDEYFYRHPEMFRASLDYDDDYLNLKKEEKDRK